MRNKKSLYLRNFIFGVEDSLVSTVGLLSGVTMAGVSKAEIVAAGIILIFVEAISMGAGSFLSEDSAERLVEGVEDNRTTAAGGIIMFLSYFLSGFIPLAPYLIFEVKPAFEISIMFSLVSLFVLGAVSARVYNKNFVRYGIKIFIIGGLAIAVGAIVGNMVNLPK